MFDIKFKETKENQGKGITNTIKQSNAVNLSTAFLLQIFCLILLILLNICSKLTDSNQTAISYWGGIFVFIVNLTPILPLIIIRVIKIYRNNNYAWYIQNLFYITSSINLLYIFLSYLFNSKPSLVNVILALMGVILVFFSGGKGHANNSNLGPLGNIIFLFLLQLLLIIYAFVYTNNEISYNYLDIKLKNKKLSLIILFITGILQFLSINYLIMRFNINILLKI